MKDNAKRSGEKRLFYGLFLIIALIFVFLYGGLFSGARMFTHDAFIWMGSFYYFVESLANGVFPLWDPYSLAGTQFYPNIHGLGLIDPLIFVSVFMVKALKTSVTVSFTYFHLLRLLLFAVGSYYFFKQVTKSRLPSLVAAGVLLFSVAPTTFRQIGILMNVFLTPFMLYAFLKVFEKRKERSKYAYLTAFALLNGISFSVFIPVYYIFNLISFAVVFFLLRLAGWTEIKELFSDKRFAAYSAVVFMLLLFMLAPPYKLFKESKSADGEIFPSVRIIQKNNDLYKMLIASDMPDDALSGKFTKHLGVYSSYGNLISLIFPDLWYEYPPFESAEKLYVERLRHSDFISEAFQYIGIFPFIAAIIGFIYSKGRWRHLAVIMMALIGANMVSFYGVHFRFPNAVQSAFNAVFPPLKMLEVRETFSAFFLLYLCLLSAFGFKILLDARGFAGFIKDKWKGLSSICAALIALKLATAAYFFKGLLVISFVDIVTLCTVALLGVVFFLAQTGRLRHAVFAAVIVGLSFADLFYYNVTLDYYVIQKNVLDRMVAGARPLAPDKGFDYFRIPFANFGGGLPLAFSGPVFRVKEAMSRGNNHHFVTSKRFYDYFTLVLPVRQFTLGGITMPVARFFPAEAAVRLENRRDVLVAVATAGEEALRSNIYLEKKEAEPLAPGMNPDASAGLHQIPDAYWLTEKALLKSYKDYFKANGAWVEELKNSHSAALKSRAPGVPRVTGFSPNRIIMQVEAPVDGYLYYNDGYSRYWRAFDNAKEVKVEPANYNSKAVFLNKGEHTVVLAYDPSGYVTALVLYFIGMSSLMLLLAYLCVKRRFERRPPSQGH